jgi:hypothetical protein
MRRWFAVPVLALALVGPAAGQPPGKGLPPAEAPAEQPAEKAAEKAQPAPKVERRCKLPGGGVRVLTLKQKQCRQQNACSCVSVCPPCV